MGALRHRRHRISAAFALFFFVAALGNGLAGEEADEAWRRRSSEREGWERLAAATVRRRLAGAGSSPPTCRFRCGRCFPCRPVHVAIQPGRSFPMEYYPEAWRCKCGKKVFMP